MPPLRWVFQITGQRAVTAMTHRWQHCVMRAALRLERCLSLRGEDLRVDPTPHVTTRPNLHELSIEGATVHLSLFYAIARLRKLRKLVLKDVVVLDDTANLGFLCHLPKLKVLEIVNCPQLTNSSFAPIVLLKNLYRLKLGVDAFYRVHQLCVGACSAKEVCLILNGVHDLNALSTLRVIRSLTELKCVAFGSSQFPEWIKEMPKLRSLEFYNGHLVAGGWNLNEMFPASLKGLACVGCRVDRAVMDSIFESGAGLIHLRLDLDHISAEVQIWQCIELRTLTISGNEVEVEILKQMALLPHLEQLDIGGIPSLNECHVQWLRANLNLKMLTIRNPSISSTANQASGI